MTELDLRAVHDEMVAVAYEAGKMILAANPADLDTGTKLNCTDPGSLPTPLALTIPPSCRHCHRGRSGRRKNGIHEAVSGVSQRVVYGRRNVQARHEARR